MQIRRAQASDAVRIAELSGQLGYPSSVEEIRTRLQVLIDAPHDVVLVIEEAGVMVGWIQVGVHVCLESRPFAEIFGLVVDEAHRGRGLGKALVTRAEAWAEERGVGRLRVRSNIIREETHRFYQSLGYTVSKRQTVFDRRI